MLRPHINLVTSKHDGRAYFWGGLSRFYTSSVLRTPWIKIKCPDLIQPNLHTKQQRTRSHGGNVKSINRGLIRTDGMWNQHEEAAGLVWEDYLLVWQRGPVNPERQVQLAEPLRSLQAPPFRHGLLAHLLVSVTSQSDRPSVTLSVLP